MTDKQPVLGREEIAGIIDPDGMEEGNIVLAGGFDRARRALAKADAILNLLSQRRSEETSARSQPCGTSPAGYVVPEAVDGGGWVTIKAARVLYVADGVEKVLCDRLPSPITLVVLTASPTGHTTEQSDWTREAPND